MKVLILWPPQVPSYFNAGHHLGLFLASAYLRSVSPDVSVRTVDAGSLNMTWKDLSDVLFEGYDVIAIMNEFDSIDGLERTIQYCRQLSPSARLLTFGRLSREIPGFFERFDLDGIAESGDHEASVSTYVSAVRSGNTSNPLPGIRVRIDEGWLDASSRGRLLEPDAWVLPSIDEIPYDAYDRLYARDENRFCGIPERRELVVPVARGCPIGCGFCDVPRQQGLKERRLSVDRAINYIESSFSAGPFEYASMYAPTFTLNRPWVLDFCKSLERFKGAYPWKCTTTLHHLDRDLIDAMAGSACVRISVGLETLEAAAEKGLPRLKRSGEDVLASVAGWCSASGVELNCFVVLGLPGTTPEGTRQTIAFARSLGARVRPTLYTPYDAMSPGMTPGQVAEFNRQLIRRDGASDGGAWYPIMFGRSEFAPPPISNRIPTQKGL